MGQGQSCCAYATGRSPDPDRRDSGSGNGKPKQRSRKSGAPAAAAQTHHQPALASQHPDPHHEADGGGLTANGAGNGGRREGSASNLQHISEREPDDWQEDPSLHPTTVTMFMEKSKQAIQSECN